MRLVFGLGNPGREYENTYHNAGLLALGSLEGTLREREGNKAPVKTQEDFWYQKYGDLALAAAKPAFFMNQSGGPVRRALHFFKLAPEDLIILHDDSDLPLGTWKLERERGSAGHHGVESIMAAIGTNDFWRGRIGIRPPEPPGRLPGQGRLKADEFVLSPIGDGDRTILEKAFQELARKLIENV